MNEKLKDELESLVLENDFIDVYKSVYNSTSEEVQNKIIKPLITDVANETVNILEKSKKPNLYHTLLSYNTKFSMLNGGASAKTGIGSSSNAVVQNNQFQRAGGVNVTLQGQPFRVTINGYTSYDKFGMIKTLSGNREIADALAELQNVNTDEINKQIMAKRNENLYTMSVYSTMALLGFDLTKDTVDLGNGKKVRLHLPSLMMVQPIIREYVELMYQNSGILLSGKRRESDIVSYLINKYNNSFEGFNNIEETAQRLFNSKDLDYKNLDAQFSDEDKELQLQIFDKFLMLRDLSNELRDLHSTINMGSDGIGISYFNVLGKINKLNSLALEDETLELGNNKTKLIGDYSSYPQPGYVKVGDYYWKPTTVEGVMLINSVSLADSIMPSFFNYKNKSINYVLNSILSLNGQEHYANSNSDKALKMKYQILSELTRAVQQSSGVFVGNIREELKRLFNEENSKASLASYIDYLKNIKHPLAEEKIGRAHV